MRKRAFVIFGCLALTSVLVIFLWGTPGGRWSKGVPIANFDGVAVYDNGPLFFQSHGRNYAADGYYFGQKWQCVEFVKRYLYQARRHRMPDVMGHAISFFDPSIPQGGVNQKRGMIQFAQGGAEPPMSGDLIVFGGAAGYGHVGIVVATGDDFVDVAQQNKNPVRERLSLRRTENGYAVEAGLPPLGWLRVANPPS